MAEIRNDTLNFGPPHPVLRLHLELDREVVQCAGPHIGLLHCTTEKSTGYKFCIQPVPYGERYPAAPPCLFAQPF